MSSDGYHRLGEHELHALAVELGQVGNGAQLRHGVVTAVTGPTFVDQATVTIDAVPMPYLATYSPTVGDWCAYVTDGQKRLALGAVGDQVPRLKVYAVDTITFPTDGTLVGGAINWQDIDADTEYQHGIDYDPNFLSTLAVVKSSGLYVLDGAVAWDANGTGVRRARFVIDGTPSYCPDDRLVPGTGFVHDSIKVHAELKLLAGQYVELWAAQSSGGNLDILPGISYMSMRKVAAYS